ERLQVTLEDLLRHRVVGRARTVGIAAVRQQAVDQLGGRGLVRGGGDRDLRRDLGTREQRGGDGQQEGKQGSGGSGVHAVARAGGGRWGSGVTVTGTASGAGSCRAGGAGTGTFRRRLATAAYGKVNRNGVANGRDGAGARSGGCRAVARSGRDPGVGRLPVGVVGRAHHRAGGDVAEAQPVAVLLQRLELLGGPVAHHRMVVRSRLQVLADGDHVHVVRAQVAQGGLHLLQVLATPQRA